MPRTRLIGSFVLAALAASPAAAQAPLALHIHAEEAMFQVLVSPGKVGSDNFVLQLMARDGSPLPAKEATLFLSLPDHGIAPVPRKASLGADGYWHVDNVALPFAGRRHLRIDAVTASVNLSLEDDITVPGP